VFTLSSPYLNTVETLKYARYKSGRQTLEGILVPAYSAMAESSFVEVKEERGLCWQNAEYSREGEGRSGFLAG
jgi:hypothetical protein